ncbi:MAG: ATP-binding protein [Clostridia bacterium]|nr:ATP-binding protein [Clostridia bacterium]
MKALSEKKVMLIFITVIVFLAILDIYLFDSAGIQINSPSASASVKPMSITEGWQYRWGDMNFDSLRMPVVDSSSRPGEWNDFTIPWSPSNTGRNHSVVLKTTLPHGSWQNPSLLFRTYEQRIQIYLGDKLIYSYGDWETGKDGFSLNSPWHMVTLPQDYSNKTVYFRVYSHSLTYTGDREEVIIGSDTDLVQYKMDYLASTIKKRVDSLILSFLFVFIGLILFFIYWARREDRKVLLSLGFFSICMGVWIFTESNAKFLFLDAPIVWLYTGYLSCQLIPVGFCSFVIAVFGDTPKNLVSTSRKAFFLLTLVNLVLDIFDIVPWSISIRAFHLFFIIAIFIVLQVILRAVRNGDPEAKILTWSFIILFVFGVYDMVDRFYLPISLLKGHHITQWAMFILTLSLIYIVGRRFVDVFDKLKIYSKEIEEKNERLNAMWLEVKNSRDQIEEWNKGLEQMVIQKTTEVKNLLDNAGQGFLTFGRDLLIDKEYSLECVSIFGERIENRRISDLLCSNEEERKYFELTLLRIFDERNSSKQELYLPLLPDETEIQGKYIHLQYKVIQSLQEPDQKVFMMVLTDITEKRQLENKVENERKTLKMVVKAVTDHHEFTKCIEDYQFFCQQELPMILGCELSCEEKLFEIYRKIHTFKGNFAQIDMVHIVNVLHNFEDRISVLRTRSAHLSQEEVKMVFNGQIMEKWLDEDMSILKEILGDNFFEYEKVLFVDQVKLVEIENQMASTLSSEQLHLLLPKIKALRYRPFKELLKPYPKFVSRLSEQLEKPIAPMNIEGGEMLVDIDRYFSFSRSLVHVFKNMVDHGIEEIEDRIEKGKNESGNIRCRAELQGNHIELVISDDGRGIDVEKIREKALEQFSKSEAAIPMEKSLSDEEALMLIFKDGITTKKYANQVSGRGIGLAAVKCELEKLGGSVMVKSRSGMGTEFHFQLPFDGIPA